MKYYELAYLTSPNSPEKVEKISKDIEAILQKEGAILDKATESKKISLAYPIKKEKEAYFCSCFFRSAADKIKPLEKILLKEKNILRFLLLTKKVEKAVPQAKPALAKLKIKPKPAKVALKDIEKKLEEILKE